MPKQLTLTYADGGLYDLANPSEDVIERAKAAFVTQFLSKQQSDRGNPFLSLWLAGKIKNNAAIVTYCALATSEILELLNSTTEGIRYLYAKLDSFSFPSAIELKLSFTVATREFTFSIDTILGTTA